MILSLRLAEAAIRSGSRTTTTPKIRPRPSQIIFADGTVWDTTAIAVRTIDLSGTSATMNGSSGNDNHVVDHRDDLVVEAANGGTDSVVSTISYTLPTDVENLTLSGVLALNGTGNSSANVITGNGLDNILKGGQAADTLIGGAGNDTYYVDTQAASWNWVGSPQLWNFTDVVTENANEGYDTIIAESVWR